MTSPQSSNSHSVLETVAYLTACNQLFERGILGKKVYIKSSDSSPLLSSMNEGFQFFSSWLDVELGKGGMTVCIVHNYMTSFVHVPYFLQTTRSHKLMRDRFFPGRRGTSLGSCTMNSKDFAAIFCHDILATLFSQFVLMAVQLSPSLAS